MQRQAVRAAFLVAVAGMALAGGVASAATQRTSGLYEARYCEFIVLRGTPPRAQATVWNTLKLNRCPEARWDAVDAGALAKELGATAVVLNGPRHFLMDSVTASTGRVHSFAGLRARKVATIPIRSASDLVSTPYTDRTINRRNTWRWKRTRLVYELVAPGGDVYVMQSYAQIRDPTLTLRKLRSLGRRLELPEGWRYRVRRLRRPLALGARGRATILQDDLLNTYQLRKAARRGKRKQHLVRLRASTRLVKFSPSGDVEDRGTICGPPFGCGTIVINGKLAQSRLTGTFRLRYRRGSVYGNVSAPFKISGTGISFEGFARFRGGTGAYRGISRSLLPVTDTNALDGQSGRVTVDGFAIF